MNRPCMAEIVSKLGKPVARPLVFFGPAAADGAAHVQSQMPPPTTESQSSEMNLKLCHKPKLDGLRMYAQAKDWLRYSSNAALTAGVRCMVTPTAAYLAYQHASASDACVGARCRQALLAVASGVAISIAGIAVNALQVVGAAALAGVCVGLAEYYFAQAALDTWLPAGISGAP